MQRHIYNALLFLCLCVPATVFIGLCSGIFLVFIFVLGMVSQYLSPILIGCAWLSLLSFYVVSGIAFIYFVAYLLRSFFGTEELRFQRRIALLAGSPFYVLCLLFLMNASAGILFFPDSDFCAATGFLSIVGSLVFLLASCGYLILTRLFLGRAQRPINV